MSHIIMSLIMSLVIFSDFWHQQFLPNIFIGTVIDPLIERLFIRPIKGQTATDQLFAPNQAKNTRMSARLNDQLIKL